MRVLDLTINENLTDWGIERTSKQKTIVMKNRSIDFDVYKIPIDLLLYNLNNGRMFMEVRKKENEDNIDLSEMKKIDPANYNNEIESLIWETSEERNEYTKKDIQKFGQIEPGVILDDGTVIDGNRRFTCLRKLHREYPNDEKFSYFQAAIIRVDGQQITNKLLKEYELRVQFGNDEKVDYKPINKFMSIYELIEKNNEDFDYTTVGELINKKPGEINKICKTCKLVDEFLDYIEKPREYQIAEEYNIYWPLEPLVTYFDNDGKNLTPVEQQKRKCLYFDYLLTLDVALMTQNLRDSLIKKVFKNKVETEKLIDKHNQIIGGLISNIINTSTSSDEFNEQINSLRHSDEAEEDKKVYQDTVGKLNDISQLDMPIKICNKINDLIDDLNIQPLISANNAIADSKLKDIQQQLKEALNKIEVKLVDIEKHEK
ncbi:MAG: hypothetical protein IKC22_07090 [Bacilli bacterium]|nr:hypothetical protein [Bacilli bacterium]